MRFSKTAPTICVSAAFLPDTAVAIAGVEILWADLTGDNAETLLGWPEVHDPVSVALDLSPEALNIPTVSEWGLIVMALLLLATGALVYVRRRVAHA